MAIDRRVVTPSVAETTPDKRPFWRDGLLWLTLALTSFAVAPFTLPGYFWGANDARHHVYFLFEFDRLVQDGIWWPRWSPDFAFGYGYPFFNIYGPLSHFLAELLLHFGGFSHTAAIETIFGLSIVGSAAAMYGFVRSWAGRQAALVAALVYVYMPYHLLNLYVRANLAESMAFVWLPLSLWAVRNTIMRPTYGWVLLCAASYGGLMLTSNLVIVLFTPMLALYALTLTAVKASERRTDRLSTRGDAQGNALRWSRRLFNHGLPGAAGLLAGLGLSANFWIPMLLEQRYVRVDQWFDGRYDFRGHFVYFHQLFSPDWGFGVSIPGPDDPLSFQLGLIPLLLVVSGLYLTWRRAGRLRWEMGVLLFCGAATLFVGLRWAAPLWELPFVGTLLGTAQFPWRWFSITTVALSALAGLPLVGLSDQYRSGVALPTLVIAALVILGSYPYLRVEITEPAEGPVSLPSLMRFQQSSDEMTGSTAWVKEIPTWSPMADIYMTMEREGREIIPLASMVDYEIVNYHKETGFVVHSEARNSIMEEVWYWSPLPGRHIVFNQFYYPGWRAYLLDGLHGEPIEELPVIPEKEGTLGRMTVPVPVGEGYVMLRFEETPPRIVGRIVTLSTLAILALVGFIRIWWARQEKMKDKDERTTAHT